MYTPNSVLVFTAAFAGAMAGMGVSERVPTATLPAAYSGLANVAGAFAQEFDTLWGAAAPNRLDISMIEECCEAVWEGRAPQPVKPFLTPGTYTEVCEARNKLHSGCVHRWRASQRC